MKYIIEISLKSSFNDHHGEHIRQSILDAGIESISKVSFHLLYSVSGDITLDEINIISKKLLIDSITENYKIVSNQKTKQKESCAVEIWLKRGVTDTVAESVVKAVRDLGINKPIEVKTGSKIIFDGKLKNSILEQIAKRLLVNPMIQVYKLDE